MEQRKRKAAKAVLTAAALSTLAASAQAVVYTEVGDAGQTIATAQAAGAFNGTTGLTQINGTIGTSTDADLYSFTLSSPTMLRFLASSTAGIDTSIFLFNSTGVALIANDDVSGTSFQGGFTTGLLAAGTYYFGVSLSGNEPINSAGQRLFTVDQPTTNVRGPASGVNPTTLATFDGQTFVAETGAYGIAISAVPEPTTNAALALGGLAATFALVRRVRRQQKA